MPPGTSRPSSPDPALTAIGRPPPFLSAPPTFAAPPEPPRRRTTDPTDDPLPTIDGTTPATLPTEPDPSSPQSSPGGRNQATDAASPPTTSTDAAQGRPARRPWTAGGNPEKVAVVVAGLLMLAVWAVDRTARVRGRTVRPPTVRQRDAIAEPLARIACRHLPLALVDEDIVDGAVTAAALHDWLDDGPLITRAGDPSLENMPPTTDTTEHL